MMLTGLEIKRQVELGNIKISDFDEKHIQPNSYDLRLHGELMEYIYDELDMKKDNPTRSFPIPEEGFVLQPGKLYLGRTHERVSSDTFASILDGRSSMGRLGIASHVTAGFVDVGFDGYLTFEIFAIKPVRIYPMVRIAQISYYPVQGEITLYPNRKYNKNNETQASMSYKDFPDTRTPSK